MLPLCFAGETKHSRKQEFNGYFQDNFGIKRPLPARFIDAYPDEEDQAEMRANVDEVVQLRKITENLNPFPLEDAEVKSYWLCFPNVINNVLILLLFSM